MKFNFFTCGGGQFWEDVFFYQKWRIQRHYKTQEFRLLDPWDIRRYEGSFGECRQAFVTYISMYQLARQKGHMIVMLHGLGETKNIFKPLWREALKRGYLAAAINYPSTRKSLESHVKQLNFFLNHLEDVQEISFITNGMGGLLLKKLLEQDVSEPWKKNLKINKAVLISPPLKGNGFARKFGKYRLFRWIFGPMLREANPVITNDTPYIYPKIDIGIISTHGEGEWGILGFLPKCIKSWFNTPEDAAWNKAKESIVIKNNGFSPFKNKRIVNASLNFIKRDKFK